MVLSQDQKRWISGPLEAGEQGLLGFPMLRVDAYVKSIIEVALDFRAAQDSSFQFGAIGAPVRIEIEGHRLASCPVQAQCFLIAG